jgi:hypothetical protein
MNVEPLLDLVGTWRRDATRFDQLGLADPARQARAYADELDRTIRDWLREPLDLETAVAESGYTYDGLRKQIDRGALHNVGQKGSPRIRRCDLPVKGKAPHKEDNEPDLVREILRRRAG